MSVSHIGPPKTSQYQLRESAAHRCHPQRRRTRRWMNEVNNMRVPSTIITGMLLAGILPCHCLCAENNVSPILVVIFSS